MEKHLIKKLHGHMGLARERTILANERNMLAYIRTGFGAFVLGLAIIKLFGDGNKSFYTGMGSILLGNLFIIAGVIYYQIRKKKILSY